MSRAKIFELNALRNLRYRRNRFIRYLQWETVSVRWWHTIWSGM